jgi:spore maturation protein CgeB
MPPADHPAFFCSSRLTLNITRGPMAASGYCPSGRLFEAAACGTPIVSDSWPGIEEFFEPGKEILIATTTDDVLAALQYSPADLSTLAAAARERALTCHSAAVRARELVEILEPTSVFTPDREVVA